MNQKPKLQLELPFLETLPHTHGSTSSPDSLPSSSVKFSTTSQISSEKITSINSSRTTSLAVGDPPARTQRLSTLRLLVIHIGGALALFLATTDTTIVSTSLPTIAREMTATHFQYTWVGVAYMLTQTAFQPLYGRFSDIVGRKTILFSSILIFGIGSSLCGAAKSINWLIAARALAGAGGGGIVSAVWTITAEIVEIESRAKWSQALSITWSCSAIAGPLLGGVFSGCNNSMALSWRWGFYMNLPICFVAGIVLFVSLHEVSLSQPSEASWQSLVLRFDFLGLALFMSGSSCIVVGFSFAAEVGWAAPSTLILIVLGIIILICGGFYEMHTLRDCLFPPTSFKDLTAVVILVVTFLHNVTFNAGTFYLALFYQTADGLSPLEAGIRMLPYSLGSSLASMPVAWFIGYRQSRTRDTSGQIIAIKTGLLLSALGFGLLITLNENALLIQQALYPLITGIGLGMLFHAPYQVFLRALRPHEVATGTSAFFLVRFTGATVGLAVAGAIFHARASSRLLSNPPQQFNTTSIDYSQLQFIEPIEARNQVLRIVSSSIQTIWAICSPCLGGALLISFLLKSSIVEVASNWKAPHGTSRENVNSLSVGEKV